MTDWIEPKKRMAGTKIVPMMPNNVIVVKAATLTTNILFYLFYLQYKEQPRETFDL